MLLTHLYEFFGVLLGCSEVGKSDAFPAYSGEGSMYQVHKFMDLSAAEFGYFVSQVAGSAASFGVATSDLTAVGTALNTLFGFKDSAPAVVVASQGPQLQAICIGDGCPEAANATTSGYAPGVEPSTAVSSLVPTLGSATGSATPMMTGSASATPTTSGTAAGTSVSSTAAGATMVMNVAAAIGGVAAFLL
jgi:hypothetical protein